MRPALALTVGDPSGIGPEVILRALASPGLPEASWSVHGPLEVLKQRARCFGLPGPGELNAEWMDVPVAGRTRPGRATAVGGRAAEKAVLAAVGACRAGRVEGIVTAPLNKESLSLAGSAWPGHTEMLAAAAGTQDVVMMFVGGGLRVALLTIHRPLKAVPQDVTPEQTRRVIRRVHAELPRLGALGRRIALCGLNPHAGEAGLFGDEERLVLAPAVAELRSEGIDVTGPLPADSLFPRASRGEFDAVVAAYHDQGLIPVKLLAFGRAVNVTLGLPFVRTSVDHGTGFDIVEQGTADPGSLLAAMELAVRLVLIRRTA